METRLIPPEEIRQQVEGRVVHLAERPIPFARQRVRVLRRGQERSDARGGEYGEEVRTEGALRLEAIEGMELSVAALLREPRPDEFETVRALLVGARPA